MKNLDRYDMTVLRLSQGLRSLHGEQNLINRGFPSQGLLGLCVTIS